MKYTIDFKNEMNLMLRNNIGLCPYFRKNARGLFERYWDVGCFYDSPKYFNKFLSKNGMSYLRNLLNDETTFGNPLFYLLFRAFVYAEIKFINNYIPQNSHEERLTGHLVSEIVNSLNIINETFRQKASELYHSKVNLDFHYADLSSNNNEKNTGADLGLIFHVNLPDYPEKINVAVIQSKKFEKRAKIDLNQIKTLEKYAGEFGYYCFYDMDMSERISPLIQKANTIMSIFDNGNNEQTLSSGKKSLSRQKITDRWEGGIPLSIFLIFDMLNPENENIKSVTNIWQAKDIIEKGVNENVKIGGHGVSRVLTVSVGGVSNSNQELRSISELFRFEKYND